MSNAELTMHSIMDAHVSKSTYQSSAPLRSTALDDDDPLFFTPYRTEKIRREN